MNSEDFEHFEHEVPPTDEIGWLDPEPFSMPIDLPDFPVAALPEPFQSMACEVERVVQISVDAPALTILSTIVAVCGSRFEVQVGSTHREPLALWTATGLGSGERKTASQQICIRPVTDWEREESKRQSPMIFAAHEGSILIDKTIKGLRNKAAKLGSTNMTAYQSQIESLERSRPQIPPLPNVIVRDITPEALIQAMARQGGRVFLVNDEGGPFQIMCGRYSSNGSANLDPYLQGHAGSPISTNRVTRCGDKISFPALSMALSVQPFVIEAVVSDDELRGKGLLARFIFAIPKSRVGTRRYSESGIDFGTATQFRNAIFHALNSSGNPETPRTIALKGKALDDWVMLHDEFERELREGGKLEHVRDWGSKAPGAIARIAGAFHIFGCEYDDPTQRDVDPEYIERAGIIIRHASEHAVAILGKRHASQLEKEAQRVLGWIIKTGAVRFEQRELQQANKSWLEADEVTKVVEALEGRNYVRRLPAPVTTGPGRKPGACWIVNPKVVRAAADAAQNAQNPQNGSEDPAPEAERRSTEL